MKNKKPVLIFVGVLVVATVILGIWVSQKLKSLNEDKSKTSELAANILTHFNDFKSVRSYPLQISTPDWGNNYLIVEEGGSDDLGITYATAWNEKLGTAQNFPGRDAKGVVVIGMDLVEKGMYVGKLGKKEKAYQRNYILRYFDLAKKAVIAQDTLYGSEPAAVSQLNDLGMGSGFPPDKEVIASIKNRLK